MSPDKPVLPVIVHDGVESVSHSQNCTVAEAVSYGLGVGTTSHFLFKFQKIEIQGYNVKT